MIDSNNPQLKANNPLEAMVYESVMDWLDGVMGLENTEENQLKAAQGLLEAAREIINVIRGYDYIMGFSDSTTSHH